MYGKYCFIFHAIGEYNQSMGGEWHLTEDERVDIDYEYDG